jgi:hypothetical protein
MMKSSLRVVPASFGPLPSVRPPSWWQKPHTVANMVAPSMSFGDASADGGVVLAAGPGPCCAKTPASESASASVAGPAQLKGAGIHIAVPVAGPIRESGSCPPAVGESAGKNPAI